MQRGARTASACRACSSGPGAAVGRPWSSTRPRRRASRSLAARRTASSCRRAASRRSVGDLPGGLVRSVGSVRRARGGRRTIRGRAGRRPRAARAGSRRPAPGRRGSLDRHSCGCWAGGCCLEREQDVGGGPPGQPAGPAQRGDVGRREPAQHEAGPAHGLGGRGVLRPRGRSSTGRPRRDRPIFQFRVAVSGLARAGDHLPPLGG